MISKGLEEARGILDFNNEVSKVSFFIVVVVVVVIVPVVVNFVLVEVFLLLYHLFKSHIQGGSLDPRKGASREPGRPRQGLRALHGAAEEARGRGQWSHQGR